ncbi:hypothetical protein EMIHUDRAFT_222903 [Emiliania huxleyi CCMP1516]|uniref:Calcineurin-like phosphoesterase domain-containing protein n=2 Tax=Emiliania huxleyi TaxID=2903 RepID=A0A0D3KXC8_EMIH1|nr:hypothetical protein EMIHUDRAFT_222903 [Emiliania huxleyi CCMP1516]EOD40413.1 hypothetical protein EMIHUDRAFT_222903 [Emiliania huxleyi CCMP1516]|eukprot:XP_005792842.1 hypothetical protein EMIHUDRAFT_222903 [Emiliania huxleyi CCMP1516]
MLFGPLGTGAVGVVLLAAALHLYTRVSAELQRRRGGGGAPQRLPSVAEEEGEASVAKSAPLESESAADPSADLEPRCGVLLTAALGGAGALYLLALAGVTSATAGGTLVHYSLTAFFVVGDWGFDPGMHVWRGAEAVKQRCQGLIAEHMRREAEERGDVAFVVNVGDSFYPSGVSSVDDPQWETRWAQQYAQLPRPRRGANAGEVVPWYSVYGSHSLSQRDLATDEVVIALDFNAADASKLCTWVACAKERCDSWDEQFDAARGCTQAGCAANLRQREAAAAALLRARVDAAASEGRSHLLAFSHYPVDYLRGRWSAAGDALHGRSGTAARQKRETLGMLRDRRVALAYFAGHRHGTENNTGPFSEPAQAFTLGGGGGWSCDGDQGYLVGEVLSDGSWDNLRLVRMERSECCGPPRSKAAWDAGCLAHSDCDQARMNWDFNSCCAAVVYLRSCASGYYSAFYVSLTNQNHEQRPEYASYC